MNDQNRQPRGTPVGGQFAEGAKAAPSAGVALTAEHLIDDDALDFARETLGPDATDDEVRELAAQRAERDLPELPELSPAQPYVVVSGGIVDNRPTLPVLDLDLMDASDPDFDNFVAVDELRATAEALGVEGVRETTVAWLEEAREYFPDQLEGYEPAPPPVLEIPEGLDGDPYILLEGGVVQNSPAIPVLDTDVLDSSFPNDETRAEVESLRDLARDVSHDWVVEQAETWIQKYDERKQS